ncbi:hypothetical protein GGR91_001796 [Sphingorhabdus rigui]|uniref:Uncharacterized protein n=1 Tax=Sphingorhabdus rigui TaxID=1282858 RepID=A0A840AZL1_9SPHN|nr:hypothetical protein [Sphingorhabdus rigui]MBB3943538.1 hypothetical protein [Sphingorhabdus rigui]
MSFDVKASHIRKRLGMKEAGIFPYEMFPHGMLKLYIGAMHVR